MVACTTFAATQKMKGTVTVDVIVMRLMRRFFANGNFERSHSFRLFF